MAEPLPIPTESYQVDGQYYGYYGDDVRFSDRVASEGESLEEALRKLLDDPRVMQLLKLKPGGVRIDLAVVGHRPMTEAEHQEREAIRRLSTVRRLRREDHERERLREVLIRRGISVGKYIPPDAAQT